MTQLQAGLNIAALDDDTTGSDLPPTDKLASHPNVVKRAKH
jgi:hypothetical protein